MIPLSSMTRDSVVPGSFHVTDRAGRSARVRQPRAQASQHAESFDTGNACTDVALRDGLQLPKSVMATDLF